MKKLIVYALCLLSCGAAYALPIGNPAAASLLTNGIFFSPNKRNFCDPCFCWFDAWSFRIGFYGDYVFDRNLRVRSTQLPRLRKKIQTTQLFTNAGFLALNIGEKLDIFGTLGATRFGLTASDVVWSPPRDTEGRFDWKTAFSWSAGARGTLFQWCRFAWGVEGQYFQTDPRLIRYLSIADGRYNHFNRKTRYREWQAGTGLSYAFCTPCSDYKFVPYVGVKWSWVNFNSRNFRFIKAGTLDEFRFHDLKNDKLWGYAIGATLTFFNKADVTVEGRFADEKAIHVNGSFRF